MFSPWFYDRLKHSSRTSAYFNQSIAWSSIAWLFFWRGLVPPETGFPGRVGCPFVLPSRKSPIEFAGDEAGAVPQCLQERGHPYGVGPQGVMKKFGEM